MGKNQQGRASGKAGGIPLSDDELEQVSGGVETFGFAFRLGPNGEWIPVTGQEEGNVVYKAGGDAADI